MAARAWSTGPGTRRAVALGLALVLAAGGLAAWLVLVDPGHRPFLPASVARDAADVEAVFPGATPLTVQVLFVAKDDGDVLRPEALTALAGLTGRIQGDPVIGPLLVRDAPLTSPLTVLAPHLDPEPGAWNRALIASALEAATASAADARMLAAHLSSSGPGAPGGRTAQAMALVVHLDARAPDEALALAQHRLQELGGDTRISGVKVHTDAPALRADALTSPTGLVAPVVAAVLLAGLALFARAPPGRVLGWALVLLGATGGGLLAGALVGHATGAGLLASVLGAGLGLTAALARPRGSPPWLAVLPSFPLLVLAGWAPAGTGALAVIAGVAALLPPAALTAAPQLRAPRRAPSNERARRGSRGLPPVLGPMIAVLLVLTLLTTAGLPDEARPGWEGATPTWEAGGDAATLLEEHFPGAGPGSEVAVAAWGPVLDPLFWEALERASTQLERVSLTADEPPVSVLSLARDWAHNDRAAGAGDRYDATFAGLWANATAGPQLTNTSEIADALARLDPEGLAGVMVLPEAGDAASGVALVRDRLSVSPAVPRPGEAVSVSVQPLLLASERLALAGDALHHGDASRALLQGQARVLLASLAAALAAALLAGARSTGSVALGGVLGGTAGLVLAGTLALQSLAGLSVSPATQLAPAIAGGTVLALGLPLIRAAHARLGDGAFPEEGPLLTARTVQDRLVLSGLPVLAVTLAAVVAPAPLLRDAGLVLVLGLVSAGLGLGLVLPGLVHEYAASPRSTGALPGPVHARVSCPVCARGTATGAARCTACGTWNLVDACLAHPNALEEACGTCGGALDAVNFR